MLGFQNLRKTAPIDVKEIIPLPKIRTEGTKLSLLRKKITKAKKNTCTKSKAQAKTKPISGKTMRINTRLKPTLGITPIQGPGIRQKKRE